MNCEVIMAKYPGYVPAIIKCDFSIEMTKKRFLLPKDQCWSYALASIRRHIVLKPSEAVFFMIDGVMLKSSDNIGNFYSQFVANRRLEDRFLVIDVFKENTFGWGRNRAIIRCDFQAKAFCNLCNFFVTHISPAFTL